ncbi:MULTISPECIES: tol-pal system protein YbgF [Halomonas]|uniref:Cell division coordinator CpoB n=1 Tax=Halomonas casei TaxID=2742613 RepID=A0ABR9F1V3_9GAMM|nr:MULTISPECIES: tol-pal system protein YbgF [Halomonas]MBE0400457.1 tol-pal system protein YbgF [Halomonas casei]PCC22591.1 tol-pal system protein YbgF [Halomonas sp. JB37]
MNHSLKRYFGRLCGAGALVLPLSVLPLIAVAQQPLVQDLSNAPSNGFYQQAQREESSGGNLVLFNQVQEHQQELQQLRGQIEELRHQLEQLRRQSQQQYLDIEDRLMSSGPTQIEQSTPAVEPEAAEQVVNAPSTKNVSEDAQADYQAAFAHVQARRFSEAIAAFEAFVTDHPDTSLTANGHYWLGELYAAEGELGEADQSFSRVINDYSGSSKVPDALYKLGLVKARQGEAEGSRELLEQVRDDYPQSSAAGLANDFLRQSAS